MTSESPSAAAQPLRGLPAGPRPIRRLQPPEAPFAGVLARERSGQACFLVDRRELEGWTGWDALPDGHRLAVRDVVRRSDGHDVVLPVCTEPLAAFLERRTARGGLSAGECVTLALCLLRGVVELRGAPSALPSGDIPHDRRADPHDDASRWWLTDDVRPVLTGGSAASAADEALELLATQADRHPALEGALGRCLRALAAPRISAREHAEIEDALFAAAQPQALEASSLALLGVGSAGVRAVPADPAPRAGWVAALAGHVDADLAELVGLSFSALRERWASRRHRVRKGHDRASRVRPTRRRALIVGAAVAGAVLAVGLWWPSGSHDTARADPSRGTLTAGSVLSPDQGASAEARERGTVRSSSPRAGGLGDDPSPEASATSAPTPSPIPDADLVAIAGRILDTRLACRGADACLRGVMLDPATSVPEGAASAPAGERSLVLLDDLGGAAVLRAQSSVGSRPQYVEIVRIDDRWLLRDVRDVGQQPSE